MSTRSGPVGVFGGTFDPVHNGHLRSALELVELLQLDHLRLMPCAQPPHGKTPAVAAGHRAAMVELAVRDEPRLSCDARELGRSGASYTVDSLLELRGELGESASLCLVMGGDAVAHLDSWNRWEQLGELAHIVVLARPGWQLPESGVVADWLRQHAVPDAAELGLRPAGAVLVERLRQLPISSTEIRQMLAAGRSPRYLLPAPVLDYIQDNQLYL
ncbi:nicotinate-nucleotide adenylyltransferase [Haliea sp. E17]|uniref:nicotinate-nucleotide adenylyltransferase n=1 Tax=Haliea sp. E17 TaxID=3401576 RepID=UPI003AB0CE01